MPHALEIDATGFRCPANGFTSDRQYLRKALTIASADLFVVSGQTLAVATTIVNPGGINEAQILSFAFSTSPNCLQMKGKGLSGGTPPAYPSPEVHAARI